MGHHDFGRSRMAGASIEATLELWASSLRDNGAKGAGAFPCSRRSALQRRRGSFWTDLLERASARKTGWMRAEAAGDFGPWRQQAILGRGQWDADTLRDIVREYALETLADETAVLVIDETGFLKQGKASCGVSRQYTGSAGKITNCQMVRSLPTCRAMAMPSSIVGFICQRSGRTIPTA